MAAAQQLMMSYGSSAASNGLLVNLVSYWKMDETSGDASDAHGSTTLTDNGAVGSATGVINKCRTFDGSTRWLSMSGNFGEGATSGSPFSISLWLKSNSTLGDRQAVGRYDGTHLFQIGMSVGYIYSAYGQSPFSTFSGVSITSGVWIHVVFTMSSSGVTKLYCNGSLSATGSSSTGTFAATTDLNFGRRGGDGTEKWDGDIDEVGWWSRELSSGDITTIYNAGAGLAYSSFTS